MDLTVVIFLLVSSHLVSPSSNYKNGEIVWSSKKVGIGKIAAIRLRPSQAPFRDRRSILIKAGVLNDKDEKTSESERGTRKLSVFSGEDQNKGEEDSLESHRESRNYLIDSKEQETDPFSSKLRPNYEKAILNDIILRTGTPSPLSQFHVNDRGIFSLYSNLIDPAVVEADLSFLSPPEVTTTTEAPIIYRRGKRCRGLRRRRCRRRKRRRRRRRRRRQKLKKKEAEKAAALATAASAIVPKGPSTSIATYTLSGSEACQYINLRKCFFDEGLNIPRPELLSVEDKCDMRRKFLDCVERERKNKPCNVSTNTEGNMSYLRNAIRDAIVTKNSCILTEVLSG